MYALHHNSSVLVSFIILIVTFTPDNIHSFEVIKALESLTLMLGFSSFQVKQQKMLSK